MVYPVSINFFTAVPNECDLENDAGEINGYWEKINWDLTLPSLAHLVFSLQQRNWWAPGWVGKLCARVLLDNCKVYRFVDAVFIT